MGLAAYSWLLLLCFALFQYHREKQFKAEELNIRLQMVNDRIIDRMAGNNMAFDPSMAAPHDFADLRISIIDDAGRVIYDNSLDTLPGTDHRDREEIAGALAHGEGFALRRHSESTGNTYFYSARKADGFVVRTAVPYSVPLHRLLAADYAFLWFMLFVTGVMCCAGFFVTRRLGKHVERLRNFAEKAERGERIFDDAEPFPHDELGEISHHIVRLYARMQQAIADRDRQHRLALHQEQEKIRIKRQLTNNINHELKTPVAAMQVCLETLLTRKQLPAEKRDEFLSRCYRANERLRRLLSDVSAITRMEEGGSHIVREPVDIGEIVAEVCGEYDAIAVAKGMTLDNAVATGIMTEGNATLLSSVFRNLIDNALAYSGGTRIGIRCGDTGDGRVMLTFSDNGSGVAPEHLPRLFERFYRVDKGRSRQAGGTGLGLAIVKNAVLWHGGTVKVVNNPDGGLRFTILLPGIAKKGV